MAEQGRYDHDYARGSYYEDEGRGRGRGFDERGGGRRSDSLFGGGSGWSEREERGWGGSPDRDGDPNARGRGGVDRGGGSWFGGSDRDRDGRHDRHERHERNERGSSWFGGGDRDETGPSRFSHDRDDRRDDHHDRHPRAFAAPRGRDDSRERSRDRGYGADDHRDDLPIDETGALIASNKVEGTAVYGIDGERLGSIYNFMVDKVGGKVEYAVMTYGGFLGMGTRYYPLPWKLLKYDTRRGGYRIDLTSRDLERAPNFDRSNEPNFDRQYGQRVHNWYGLSY